MAIGNKVSTGITGLDQVVNMLRLGDNVVWQVQSIEDYLKVVRPYVEQAKADGRRLVYLRFGSHPALLAEGDASVTYRVDPAEGFESFATKVHDIIDAEGLRAFYVFDCLSDLLDSWYSDLMIGNFFKVTCPFLYQLDTLAYFAIIRGRHTYDTIARIRETTQLLMDIYCMSDKLYIHPLKVWERYSPTMFFPHLIQGDQAVSITSSADTAALLQGLGRSARVRDNWEMLIDEARDAIFADAASAEAAKRLLIKLLISKEPRMVGMAERYFSLAEVLDIAGHVIGTGFIGGKSVGMLLGRKILESAAPEAFAGRWEPHDSFYLGADIFYTYIVANGWWDLRTKQRQPEHYFTLAPELREKLLHGSFPDIIREQFIQMLEHYGQSPIIIRSSSLLEDNYGNAFAGKYESVFLANQGTPDERYEAFEQAVRTVYASTMSDDALAYRQNRNLASLDEQMAILVQRVSGDHYGHLFFPHIGGMGNSANLYVWNKDMDPSAGMLRLVFGLGTRAVDRVSGDYARIVTLDDPGSGPPVHQGDEKRFSQHKADILDLRENRMIELSTDDLSQMDLKTDKSLFFSEDYATISRLREQGRSLAVTPQITDFRKLLTQTDFPKLARTALDVLEEAYGYPVDIEFTANFTASSELRFNLLQCRPLQTKGLGAAVQIPEVEEEGLFFSTEGSFMGGNVRLSLDWVVLVKTAEYLALSEREKYGAARAIGALNRALAGRSVLVAGPGRWGTTTPSLGVPVNFSELNNMAAICEVAYKQAGLMPELSFGSHFFQDLVESDIFYAAIFDGDQDVTFRPERVLGLANQLAALLPEESGWAEVIHVAQTPGLTLYSDITSQKLLCFG